MVIIVDYLMIFELVFVFILLIVYGDDIICEYFKGKMGLMLDFVFVVVFVFNFVFELLLYLECLNCLEW